MEFCLSGVVGLLCYPLLVFLLALSFAGNSGTGRSAAEFLFTSTAIRDAYAAESVQDTLPYLFDSSVFSEGKLVINSKIADGNLSDDVVANFQPWGPSALRLTQASDKDPIVITGSTGNQSSGFTARGLGHSTRQISIALDSLTKSRDSQVSFSFLLSDGNTEYTILLVNGPLSVSGWKGSTYYGSIVPAATGSYDMDKIFGISGISLILKQVTIVVQKNTDIRAEFDVNVLSPEQYQSGIHHADRVLYDGIIAHDLQIERSAVLQFNSPSPSFKAVDNGWQTVDFNPAQGTLTAFKPSQSSLIEEAPHIDWVESLSLLGAKDLLFVAVIGVAAGGLVLFPSKAPGKKVA